MSIAITPIIIDSSVTSVCHVSLCHCLSVSIALCRSLRISSCVNTLIEDQFLIQFCDYNYSDVAAKSKKCAVSVVSSLVIYFAHFENVFKRTCKQESISI